MAEMQIAVETEQQPEQPGAPDVLVGVAGSVSSDDFRIRAEQIAAELRSGTGALRIVFACPGPLPEPPPASGESDGPPPTTVVSYQPPPSGAEFWSDVSANQRAVLALAAEINARACIVLGSDLAALQAQPIRLLTYAVLERQCALAMPLYPAGKYDGLINTGILSPLHRALYGKRVRFPVTYDFAASGAMCAHLARSEPRPESSHNGLLWPVAVAATQSPQSSIGQVHLDVHHQVVTAGLDLSAVLGQLAGSLFHEMEMDAAHWQRVRGSQAAPAWGSPPADEPGGEPIDPQPMLDSFLLGSKNLDEVWRLVLPPNTLLELRRLTRLAPDQFHMPDELWAGIVYDFALAWRLRTISRVHLLGALTPLYLGWVASYVREVAGLTRAAAEQRVELLARAWEMKKPYLLSRWRWPDRFNP
ncbi:MAG TPA: hypothetical protein VHX60_12330 [Acidobacteriaceae bacterium]|jgi:hypothetical protein|nr:hypothetical protein [Acidobacteriaceae bacterium]